jgi:hypothetical protein
MRPVVSLKGVAFHIWTRTRDDVRGSKVIAVAWLLAVARVML